MRKSVYIETTIVSYYVSEPSRDIIVAGHQEATREIWPELLVHFDTYISALVFQEAARGNAAKSQARLNAIKPFRMLDIDEDCRALAEKILSGKGIPSEYPEDALHIAIASVHRMDILLTWNFAHLNNPFTRLRIRRILEKDGYVVPEICSPEELLEADL